MNFREAKKNDIPQMQIVRNSVNENQLSDPALVKDSDYEDFLLERGKGWICEVNNTVVGFAIVDLQKIISGRCLLHLFMQRRDLAKNCTQ